MYDLSRTPLLTTASAAELAQLPADIRQQALFSARLNLADPLAQIGASIKGILDGDKSLSESRRDIRASMFAAGYTPPAGTEGGLRDHTSRTRLDLILGQNVRFARGYGHRAAGMDPDVLDAFPAQELVRVMHRRKPRESVHPGYWRARFVEAGGTLYGRRMIALKTDPVWIELSEFGLPYPPFNYNSGMGLLDISREEAVDLGVIAEDETLTPDPVKFPATTEANLPNVAVIPALDSAISNLFGNASFVDGVLSFIKS